MNKLHLMGVGILAAGMVAGNGAVAQSASSGMQTSTERTQTETSTQEAAQPSWAVDQLVTASVHDAWVMSGRNEQKFFEMVSQLAQISAQKRGLNLPDSVEAGKRFGELVKSMAKQDHDQLLYVVVDKAVQQVAPKS